MYKILLSIIGLLVVQSAFVSSAKLDGVEIDEILENSVKRDQYVDCLKGTVNCTRDGKKLQDVFKLVLQRGENTDEVSSAGCKLVQYLAENLPDILKELTERYAPNGIWQKIKDFFRKPIDWIRRFDRNRHNHNNNDDVPITTITNELPPSPTINPTDAPSLDVRQLQGTDEASTEIAGDDIAIAEKRRTHYRQRS